MFDKAIANAHMAQHGFATLPNCRIDKDDIHDVRLKKAREFFARAHVDKVVVKPSAGGSSLGVATAATAEEAVTRAEEIFVQKHGIQALIEPYCEGREFTIVVLQNKKNEPVALVPTEIELIGGDLFTFRHKYLPTCHVEYHCPPRFDDEVIAHIQKAAEVLFSFFGMRDFSRLDGWLLDDGRFEGKAVVPPGWVERMRRPVSASGHEGFGVELASAAHGAEAFAADDVFFLRGPGRWRLWLVPTLNLGVMFGSASEGTPAWDETRLPNLVIRAVSEGVPQRGSGSQLQQLVPGH